jgi:hypothetical protein
LWLRFAITKIGRDWGLAFGLEKHFEDGLPGFMSKMRHRRKSGGALGNTFGAGSGGC